VIENAEWNYDINDSEILWRKYIQQTKSLTPVYKYQNALDCTSSGRSRPWTDTWQTRPLVREGAPKMTRL
jgi:hypothetical protein